MKKLTLLVAAALTLTGCTDGPSRSDIEKAYSESWSGKRAPQVDEVDWYECKEVPDYVLWRCRFRVVFENGQTVEKNEHFAKTAEGWIIR